MIIQLIKNLKENLFTISIMFAILVALFIVMWEILAPGWGLNPVFGWNKDLVIDGKKVLMIWLIAFMLGGQYSVYKMIFSDNVEFRSIMRFTLATSILGMAISAAMIWI
jgi:hypothetical protein